MNIKHALTGLSITVLVLLLAAGSAGAITTSERPGDRVCHLDVGEKRKASGGKHQWTVRQIDRWCVRDGRIVTVTQNLQAETSNGWRLVSKRGTTRITKSGVAVSQGRFEVVHRNSRETCSPRIVARLEPDGDSRYETVPGC